MPAKKKDKSLVMQRKLDRQKQEANLKPSVSRRVDYLLPKKAVLKGKEAEIEKKLLGRFEGPQGRKEREIFSEAVEERKAAEGRRTLKNNPKTSDNPFAGTAEDSLEPSKVACHSDSDSADEEIDFDLTFYDDNLWADSGSAFVRRKENKDLRKVLLAKRWLVVVLLANSTSVMADALQRVRLKRTLVAHLWASDLYMHAVSCVQRAFFRFLARRHSPHPRDEVVLHRRRRSALIEGSLHHAGIEESLEERQEMHQQRLRGAAQIVKFLRDVEDALSFKVTINRYCMSIKRLQGLLRRHFVMNRARLHALNKLFDIFCTAIISHAQVLDNGQGLDVSNTRGNKMALMRALHKGVSKLDEGRKLISKMKTPAFHTFFRNPSVHKGFCTTFPFKRNLVRDVI